MTEDRKTPVDQETAALVRRASKVIIAAGALVGMAVLSVAGFMVWRHFAYQQAAKRCGIGLLNPSSVALLDELKARYGEATSSDCMRQAGF